MADATVELSRTAISLQLSELKLRINEQVLAIGETVADGQRDAVQSAADLAALQLALDPIFQEIVDLALNVAVAIDWINEIGGDPAVTIVDPNPATACGGPGFPCPLPSTISPEPGQILISAPDVVLT